MKLLFILIFIPIVSFSQQVLNDDSIELKYIIENCNSESIIKATNLLKKYRKVHTDNQFDWTLKTYFEILQYPKCKKYDKILESLWIENKVISESFFHEYFLNKKSNYPNLLIGFKSRQDFRFADNNPNEFNLNQGINNSLCLEILKYIKKESEDDYLEAVQHNIEQLESHDLLNFINVVRENFDLNDFQKDLITKMQDVEYPFGLNFLINELIKNEKNHPVIENTLNNKKAIWDKGNWSKKYWDLIKKYNFKIENEPFYSLNENGNKIYDIDKFISFHTKNGEIGKFPIISVDYELKFNYSENFNSLKEYLETLDIQSIEVIKSEDAVELYGSRGKDGFLAIMTK